MEYRHKESQPKKFKRQASDGKAMLTVFWNSERVVLADFLENKATINSRYIETSTQLKRIQRIGIRNKTLQHNARPHTSAAKRDAIQRPDFLALLHPPYSPDLATSNFHLLPKL